VTLTPVASASSPLGPILWVLPLEFGALLRGSQRSQKVHTWLILKCPPLPSMILSMLPQPPNAVGGSVSDLTALAAIPAFAAVTTVSVCSTVYTENT
jgi:hypothetical protein